MTERILVAGFSHETNTYADEPTTREEFRERGEYVGQEIIDELAGTNTAIGGAIEVAESEGVDLVPVVSASATPGGLVSRETYEHYTNQIVEGAREHADEIDGVLLALHGAMVPEAEAGDGEIGEDGEGPLVEAVREAVGDVPIVVTHDLHGNITDHFLSVADALVAYETYPHVDTGATGRNGTELLLEIVRGEADPVMAVERPPVLAYGPRQNTREGPMAEVMARARELEARDSILKVNVFPGFQAADVPSVGFSIPVVADGDEAAAREAARELAEEVWNRREQFVGDYPEADEGVALAAALAGQREESPFDELPQVVDEGGDPEGPVVVADVGDNPGGGGTADTTPVLRALLEQGVENAGFAIMRDPEVVEACVNAGVGEHVSLTLGGKTSATHGEPIEGVEGYVKAITDGYFRNTGPMSTGTDNRLGRTVRLHCRLDSDDESKLHEAGVTVIVTENRLQPLDAEIWRHVGVQPERLDVLVVKSTNHFRADYEPMASYVIPVDSPGVAAMNPEWFDYERVRRPQFPMDEMDDDAYPDW